MKYSITRALSELKLLKQRVEKEIKFSSLIAVKHGQKLRTPYTSYKEEDFEEKAKSQYQSIISLLKRINEIKTAINKSNFETIVKIGGEEMTVLEALVKKSDIEYEKDLLLEMKQQLSNARDQVNIAMSENRRRIENNVKDQITSSADITKTKEVEKEVTEHIENLYKISFVDPLTLESEIKKFEERIEEFEKNVDFVLSESNSTTFIEVSD